jgi:uncharacterized RDD family membrane protein YckC
MPPEEVDAHGRTLTSASGSSAPGGPAASGSQPGRRLAHFRLERPLGRGGMGEVWLATDLALERPVAVKLLGREVAERPRLRDRFLREARAQARIHHPNVGHIYYVGEDDGQLFFAMEYIAGESLQDRLAREGKLPPEQAVELCRQAALGLREAHRHGFTHRDVKPSNLMVDEHGAVKLVDFGIAKEHGEAAEPATVAGVAATGAAGTTMLGTPLYMAPEQARGDAVDFRADVYALGATLHHLVAGQPPFRGDTAMKIVSQHLADLRPRLPAGKRRAMTSTIDTLCDRMMAKRPEDRFASYDALIDALEQASPAFVRPAGFWVRAFALMLDFLVCLLLLAPAKMVFGDGYDGLIVPIIGAIYTIPLVARYGRTLGKMALEISVVRAQGGGLPGWRVSLRRYFAQWTPAILAMGATDAAELLIPHGAARDIAIVVGGVLIFVPSLAFALASLWTQDRRTLWDRIAGTRVRYLRQ